MFIYILLLVVTAVSLYTDLKHKKIYNAVVLPAAVLALVYHLITGGPGELWWAVQGLLLGTALLFIPFALGGMGAGDVKLMGFIGACGGPGFAWIAFLGAAVAGGLLAVIILIKEKQLFLRLKLIGHTFISLFSGGAKVNMLGTLEAQQSIAFPYGAAITAGAIIACLVR